MNVEIGNRTLYFCFGNNEAAQFHFWEYIKRNYNRHFYWILTSTSTAVHLPCLLEESLYFINNNLLPPWQLFCFLLLTWPHGPQDAAAVAPESLIYSSPDWMMIRQPPPDWSGSALGCWSADAALHNLSWSNMVQRKSMFQPYHSFLLNPHKNAPM